MDKIIEIPNNYTINQKLDNGFYIASKNSYRESLEIIDIHGNSYLTIEGKVNIDCSNAKEKHPWAYGPKDKTNYQFVHYNNNQIYVFLFKTINPDINLIIKKYIVSNKQVKYDSEITINENNPVKRRDCRITNGNIFHMSVYQEKYNEKCKFYAVNLDNMNKYFREIDNFQKNYDDKFQYFSFNMQGEASLLNFDTFKPIIYEAGSDITGSSLDPSLNTFTIYYGNNRRKQFLLPDIDVDNKNVQNVELNVKVVESVSFCNESYDFEVSLLESGDMKIVCLSKDKFHEWVYCDKPVVVDDKVKITNSAIFTMLKSYVNEPEIFKKYCSINIPKLCYISSGDMSIIINQHHFLPELSQEYHIILRYKTQDQISLMSKQINSLNEQIIILTQEINKLKAK